jgi:outer membrane protein
MNKILITCTFLFLSVAVYSQDLKKLLSDAAQNYPLLRAKHFETLAKADQIKYAKSAAVPSLDAGYQINYATYNNITGMATAQHFVPISGPPSSSNSSDAVVGSVAGVVLNWDIFTFGQRSAEVRSAKALAVSQGAEHQSEIFQHQVRTAQTYLDLLMSNELVKAYAKHLERSEHMLRIVRSLSRTGLRPGVDTALFQAEISRARIDLLNQEKLKQTFQFQLKEFLGGANVDEVRPDTTFVNDLPEIQIADTSFHHPALLLSRSRLEIAEYQKKALTSSMLPKLSLWATAYGRGSGIRYDGYVNSEDGLSFSRYNYGTGLVLSIPLLNFARTQHQIRAQSSLVEAERERLNATTLQLSSQNEIAEVTLAKALAIANECPTFYDAAGYAYRGLLSRYNSGIVNYADLIQAQYVLLNAEADLKKAYIDAWKALLYKAYVNGDVAIFTDQL